MDISKIKAAEILVEIVSPDEKAENIGVRVSLISLTDDTRTKKAKREIANRGITLQRKGKSFDAEEIENNENKLLFASMTGWEWYAADFNGEKLLFNEQNVIKVFDECPWFKKQIQDKVDDPKSFFIK